MLLVLGLVRGLSGALAFVVALSASAATGVYGWTFVAARVMEPALRIFWVIVAVLIVYALTRWMVKKLVGGLLTQPSDSIFGVVLALLCTAALLAVCVRVEALRMRSFVAQKVSGYVC